MAASNKPSLPDWSANGILTRVGGFGKQLWFSSVKLMGKGLVKGER